MNFRLDFLKAVRFIAHANFIRKQNNYTGVIIDIIMAGKILKHSTGSYDFEFLKKLC